MNRSRLAVVAGAFTVGVGALVAMGALYLDPARAAVGPLPAEGLAFPADTKFVMGFDVARMVSSPFYSRYGQSGRPAAFGDLEDKTGINPERDVDAVYVASQKAGGGPDHGVVLVVGRFDRDRVTQAIEASDRGATKKELHGTNVYLFNKQAKGRGTGAVAFLDEHTLIFGSQSSVEATLATRAAGDATLRQNPGLTALLEKVKPGSTFWMVGDQSLLAQMPKGMPGGGDEGTGHAMALPALRSVVVTGDLDPELSLDVVGEAADEAGARNLADVVRGLLALAALQANQKPEMKELASAVSVTTDASSVRISARFPYELIDALQKQHKKPAGVALAAPRAPAAALASATR